MSKLYNLTPELTKSSYEIEEYSKDINDESITICVSTLFRWSEFEINLNNEEKEKLLNKNNIVLNNDYEYEFISSNDGLYRDLKIVNINKYSKDFINIIFENIYGSDNHPYDDALNELEENGWTPGDVSYELSCKCILNEIKD